MEAFDPRGSERIESCVSAFLPASPPLGPFGNRIQVACHENTRSSNEKNSLGTMGVSQELVHSKSSIEFRSGTPFPGRG